MDSDSNVNEKLPLPERTSEEKYDPSFRKVSDRVPCSFNLSNSHIQLVTQVNVSQAVLQQQRIAPTGPKLSLPSKPSSNNKVDNEFDAKLTTADAIRRLRERVREGSDQFLAKRLQRTVVAEGNKCGDSMHINSDRTNGYKLMRTEDADKRWKEIISSEVVRNTEVTTDGKETLNADMFREKEKSLVGQSDTAISTFSDSDSSVEVEMTAVFPSLSSDHESSYGENLTVNMSKLEDYTSSEEDSPSPPLNNTKIDGIFSRLERTFSNSEEENSFNNNAVNTSDTDGAEGKQVTGVENQNEFSSSRDNELFTSATPHTTDCQDLSFASAKDCVENNSEQSDDKSLHSPSHSTFVSFFDTNSKSASLNSVTFSPKLEIKADKQVIENDDCPYMAESPSSRDKTVQRSFDSSNESTVDQSSPHSNTQSIDMDSKIPKLAFKLKNVYQSMLHTDFSATFDKKANEFSKINGIVHMETDKVKEEELKPDAENSYPNLLHSSDGKNGNPDSIGKSQIQTDCSGDTATDSCQFKTDDGGQGSAINHVSPCSKKLMLHATTKTPLPAKKSYIQQVQSTGDVGQPHLAAEFETSATVKDTVEDDSVPSETSHTGWIGEGALSVEPDQSAEYADPDFKFTPAGKETTDVNEDVLDNNLFENVISQDCEKSLTEITSSIDEGLLQRQDSGSSSPAADTDDGLRRSARIRTKKNERTKYIQKNKLPVTVSEASSTEIENSRSIQSTPDESEKSPQFTDTCHSIVVSRPQSSESHRNLNTPEGKNEESFKDKIRLVGGLDESPHVFEVLEENIYLTKKKKSRARKEIRRMVCDCASEDGPEIEVPCGENCLNRLLMIECSSRCHFDESCTNKRFQKRQYAPSEVFKTEFKGWGLRAARDIEAGQLIMEYCGEVVDQREFTLRSMKYSESNHQHFYFMALSQDEVIDATYKGNASRFINHSCDPNAETQKWTVNGRLRVGFFTLRRIENQQEITFDYQFERYGKVAQKCYCGSPKCRGYLGKAPDDNKTPKLSKKLSSSVLSGDDTIEEAVSDQLEKDKRKNKKKVTLFEDNTMEKEISRLLGGLRSSKEVLTLSRLMVRCDTQSQRAVCLQVLRETISQTRLRTFLQFHGLPIIWSWMVDTGGTEDEEASSLKLDILNTLSILPITNRNIIEDSKVLSVVHRWSSKESGKISPADSENGIMKDSNKEKVSDEDSKQEDGSYDATQEDQNTESADRATEQECSSVGDEVTAKAEANTSNMDEVTKTDLPTDNVSEDSSEKSVVTDENINTKIQTAAQSLLNSWKDLREIYRIPKRQKPTSSPQTAPTDDQESSSRDNSHSRTTSPMPKRGRTDDGDSRASGGCLQREDSQERSRDGSERSWDYDRNRRRHRRSDYRDSKFSPNYYGAEDRMPESSRRKRRLSNDSGDQSPLNRKEIPWHCRPPQGSRMSRLEHRRRFEKDVQKREQDKKRRVDETANHADNPVEKNLHLNANKQQAIDGNMSVPAAIQMVPGNPTFTSSGYSGNLIQINPAPQAQMMMPYVDHSMNSQMAVMPQVMNASEYVMQQNAYGMTMGGQQEYVVYTQDPNIQTGYANMQNQQQITVVGQQDPSMSVGYSMDPNMQNQHSINTLMQQDPSMQVGVSAGYNNMDPSMQNQQSVNAFGQPMMNNQANAMQQQQNVGLQTAQQQTSNVTILGSQNGQAIVLLTQEQLQKLTQGDQSSSTETVENKPATAISSSSTSSAETKSNKSDEPAGIISDRPTDPRPPKLPPNWKTATDNEGRIYYYHVITRQTQWDPPTWGGKEEDMVGKKEAEMELSSTPTYDERKHKSSKLKGESVTEEGKKSKEVFRLKMSKFVVQCLGSFRKSDCKVGRITSTEDFKHVARKLTHNVMLKEIKQVQVLEDLDFNANVRHKTKEYVKKYMSRVGPVYRIRDDNPLDPA